jgi:hypothetical protein
MCAMPNFTATRAGTESEGRGFQRVSARSASFMHFSRRAMLSAFAGLPALAVISSKKAATADDLSSSVDPLPSWNKTEIKGAIVAFVNRVTNQGAPDCAGE